MERSCLAVLYLHIQKEKKKRNGVIFVGDIRAHYRQMAWHLDKRSVEFHQHLT